MSRAKFFITLSFLWLSHFLVDFMIGIWPIYKTIAKLDIAIMGLIAGISVFIGEALQLFFGSLSDRGYRKFLIIAGLFSTCACSLVSYTNNYFILFFLFQITCLGSGAFHPSAVGLVGSLSENKKGVLITLFSMGGALGFSLSQLIFSKFYLKFNGETALLMIPALLLGVGLLFYKMAGTEKPAQLTKKPLTLKSVAALFKKEHLSTLYFAQFCNSIVGWGTFFLLPDILCSRDADSWICFGGGHLFFVLGGALMMVPSGYLADKFSFKKVLMSATSFGLIFFFVFLKFPFISNEMLLMLLFLMGASTLIINPLIIAFGNKLHPKEPGAISGFLMGFVWCFANPLGMAGGGLLTKLFTVDAAANALSILCLFFITQLAITWALPSTHKLKTSPEFGI